MNERVRNGGRSWRRVLGAVAAGLAVSFALAGPASAEVVPVVPGAGAVGACMTGGGDTSSCVDGAVAAAIAAALPGGANGGTEFFGDVEGSIDEQEDGGHDYDQG